MVWEGYGGRREQEEGARMYRRDLVGIATIVDEHLASECSFAAQNWIGDGPFPGRQNCVAKHYSSSPQNSESPCACHVRAFTHTPRGARDPRTSIAYRGQRRRVAECERPCFAAMRLRWPCWKARLHPHPPSASLPRRRPLGFLSLRFKPPPLTKQTSTS